MPQVPDPGNSAAAETLVAESWKAVLEAWNAPGPHQEFLALCDELERLDQAAACYASQRQKRPGDPLVREMTSQILFRAGLRLERVRKRDTRSRGSKLRFVVLLLVLLLVPLLLLHRFASHRQTRLELQRRLEARTSAGPAGQGDRR